MHLEKKGNQEKRSMKMKCGFLDLTMNLVTLHQHNGKIFKLQELEAEQMIFKKRSQRLYIWLHSTGIPNHNNGLHFIFKKKNHCTLLGLFWVLLKFSLSRKCKEGRKYQWNIMKIFSFFLYHIYLRYLYVVHFIHLISVKD